MSRKKQHFDRLDGISALGVQLVGVREKRRRNVLNSCKAQFDENGEIYFINEKYGCKFCKKGSCNKQEPFESTNNYVTDWLMR